MKSRWMRVVINFPNSFSSSSVHPYVDCASFAAVYITGYVFFSNSKYIESSLNSDYIFAGLPIIKMYTHFAIQAYGNCTAVLEWEHVHSDINKQTNKIPQTQKPNCIPLLTCTVTKGYKILPISAHGLKHGYICYVYAFFCLRFYC